MAQTSHRHTVECSQLETERTAAVLHLEFGRGKANLKAIASCAPLLGLFGTVVAVIQGLRDWHIPGPFSCEIPTWSAVLIPMAIGIPVALVACCGACYIERRVEIFDLEMRTVSLSLVNDLAKFCA